MTVKQLIVVFVPRRIFVNIFRKSISDFFGNFADRQIDRPVNKPTQNHDLIHANIFLV